MHDRSNIAPQNAQEETQKILSAQPSAHGGAVQHAKKHRTTGNILFDWLVYPSIAFGAVFAFSIYALYTTKFGKGKAKDMYDGLVTGLGNLLEKSSLFKNASREDIDKKSANYVLISVSFAVGTALMAPIKWLEDKRGEISRFFDRKLHSDREHPEEIMEEPRQSWKSVLGGRALTFISVLGLGTAIGPERTAKVTDAAVNFAERKWKDWWPQASQETLERVKRVTFVSTFEAFYTALCAVLVYAISRTLASWFNKQEKAAENAPEKRASTEEAPPSANAEERTSGPANAKMDPYYAEAYKHDAKASHARRTEPRGKPVKSESHTQGLNARRAQEEMMVG